MRIVDFQIPALSRLDSLLSIGIFFDFPDPLDARRQGSSHRQLLVSLIGTLVAVRGQGPGIVVLRLQLQRLARSFVFRVQQARVIVVHVSVGIERATYTRVNSGFQLERPLDWFVWLVAECETR